MSDDLLDLAVATTGGQRLWDTVAGLRIDISIGGPIWALKGRPTGTTFEQIITVDTVRQRILFSPFTRPDREMVFDATTDTVKMQTLEGNPFESLSPARASFKGMLRNSAWDALHLGYFLGYACWNYFTTPFLFTYPGVHAREIEPWQEAGQTWRRLAVRFPPSIAEVNGSALVGHYTSRHKSFDGLLVATRRRVFRRNPDNNVNLNLPSITLDIHDAELIRADNERTQP
jgi:hypothetical protein